MGEFISFRHLIGNVASSTDMEISLFLFLLVTAISSAISGILAATVVVALLGHTTRRHQVSADEATRQVVTMKTRLEVLEDQLLEMRKLVSRHIMCRNVDGDGFDCGSLPRAVRGDQQSVSPATFGRRR